MKEVIEIFLNWIEDIWVKYYYIICFILGLGTAFLHHFGKITNLRSSLSNIVTFTSIIIGVLGVFLTLLITLQESPVFERLKTYYPQIQQKLFLWLRSQIWAGMIFVLLCVIISVLPNIKNKGLIFGGVTIWGAFFWLMSIGSFYSVKLITDLIIKNFNIPKRNTRE